MIFMDINNFWKLILGFIIILVIGSLVISAFKGITCSDERNQITNLQKELAYKNSLINDLNQKLKDQNDYINNYFLQNITKQDIIDLNYTLNQKIENIEQNYTYINIFFVLSIVFNFVLFISIELFSFAIFKTEFIWYLWKSFKSKRVGPK